MTDAERNDLRRQAELRLTAALINVQGGYLVKARDRAKEAVDSLTRIVGGEDS